MEFLLLISYFIHWVYYPNIATNCAFDMHKQERGRQGGREAEREKREKEQERAAFFFSARDCFNWPMSPCLKALQIKSLCQSLQCQVLPLPSISLWNHLFQR